MKPIARRTRSALTLVLLSAAGLGCPMGGTVDHLDARSLAGTRWRLIEIRSMDDAIGTTRPDDPSKYTLAFAADGTLAMRLDCNRAMGRWSATPAADSEGGQLRVGPLAATRALCPEPSLDERIARDMDYVRSYLVKDGRLHLSLMADGGIYVWERDPS